MARTSLLDCLPQVFQTGATEGGPLRALIAAADDMLDPVAAVLDGLDAVIDPFRSPEPLAAMLAWWVDLGWLTLPDADEVVRSALPGASGPLRDLVAASADLSARRGTAAGMIRFLEIATRTSGFRVEVVPGQFHVRVHVPEAAVSQLDAVSRIVERMKPAHVTAELVNTADVVSTAAPVPHPHDPEGAPR